MMLNPLLRRDLLITCGEELEIHFYKQLAKGMTAFRKNAGVTTDKLPTAAQVEAIEKEEETLPPGRQMYDLPPVYSVPNYRRAAMTALGYFLPPEHGGGGLWTSPFPSTTSAYTQPTQGTIKPTGDDPSP